LNAQKKQKSKNLTNYRVPNLLIFYMTKGDKSGKGVIIGTVPEHWYNCGVQTKQILIS